MNKMQQMLRLFLMGPAYFYHRWLVRRSKRWSAAKVARYQKTKASKLHRRYGTDINDKSTYMRCRGRFDMLSNQVMCIAVRTGGTTGNPFQFRMDRFWRRQKERAYIFDIWSEVGYRPFDARVVFRGNVSDSLISYRWLENAWIISPSRLNRDSLSEVLDTLRSIGPFFLHVYPSSLAALIDLVGEEAFRSLPIRGVLAGSEAFPPQQIAAFETQFGIPVSHWYGHSEYAVLARYCKVCEGFHFYPTYGLAELVPVDHKHARICATSFNLLGTRFIRYDTEDLAAVSSIDCSEPFMRVDKIVGRAQDFFVDASGHRRAFGPMLFGIHDEFWDVIAGIQFCQQEEGELIVRTLIKVNDRRKWLEEYLRNRFSKTRLKFEYPEELEKTAAGKHRYFISAIEDIN